MAVRSGRKTGAGDTGSAGPSSQSHEDAGPTDRLAWLLRARNTATHRPPRTNLSLLLKRGQGLSRPLYSQSGWSESEALLETAQVGTIFGFLLDDTPVPTLTVSQVRPRS